MSRFSHKLRVFENRVLRKIFGPKRDEVLFAKYNYNDQVMGGVCTNGGEEESI
jgi:hypothetical protein